MCQVFIYFIILFNHHNNHINSLLPLWDGKAKSGRYSNLYNLYSMEELMLRYIFRYISILLFMHIIHGAIMICFTSGAHLWQVRFFFWEQRKSSLLWPLIICWGSVTSSGEWSVRRNAMHHDKRGHIIPHHGARGCCMFAEIGWRYLSDWDLEWLHEAEPLTDQVWMYSWAMQGLNFVKPLHLFVPWHHLIQSWNFFPSVV